MDEEYQRMAANSIAHEAFCVGQAWQQAAAAQERPCVLWKPSLFRDGNQWCVLLGENIQDGVVGFGDSPDAAMLAFDAAWREKLAPAPSAQPTPSIPEGWKKDLFCIQHAMAMNNWNWESDASNNMKRAAYAAISKILTEVMDIAVANGANSRSMPDEYVEVAAWLCGVPAQKENEHG